MSAFDPFRTLAAGGNNPSVIDIPTIYADFQNADAEGFVRLNTEGTQADLEQAGVALTRGLRIQLSDGELQTEGVVVDPGSEGVWRAQIDWAELAEG